MDFLRDIITSPQVQGALNDLQRGITRKSRQIVGLPPIPDKYELRIDSPEVTKGPMPIISTPDNFDHYLQEQGHIKPVYDFPLVASDGTPMIDLITQEIQERKAFIPRGPSPMMFTP